MWGAGDTSFGGGQGGFITGTDSPSVGDKPGRSRRSQNVMPVAVKQLLQTPGDETLKVEGFEANVVSIVGLVRAVETTTTKISMYIDDQSGTIECIAYNGSEEETNSQPTVLCEGTYGRVVGSLRVSTKEAKGKYVLVFKAMPVTDMNEVTCHLMEVINNGIKLKKLREAEEKKSAGGDTKGLDNTFGNSLIGAGLGGGATGGVSSGGNPGFTSNQNMVHQVIASVKTEVGMHRDQVIAAVRNRIPQKEIMDILDFLSNEGHIFSTIDDDHYSATDSNC